MKRISPFAAVLLLALAAPARSSSIWAEVADAGDLPSTAQIPLGAGPLDAIIGDLLDPGGIEDNFLDIDMYRLFISNPATFSAMTVNSPLNVSDPQLFLFDALGQGVYMDDDDESGLNGSQSLLPAGLPLGPVSAGFYYLAIGWFNNEPLDALASLIFDTTSATGVNGPAGSAVVAAWDNHVLGRLDLPTAYEIQLTGARIAAPVPEPAPILLLTAGLGALALRQRRRPRKA